MIRTVIYRKISVSLLTVSLALAMASCGSTKHTAHHNYKASSTKTEKSSDRRAPKRVTTEPRRHIDLNSPANPVTKKLLTEADSWIGTPYAWGGNDRSGVDCSGFVLQVYLRSLEISLPRTSEQQQQYCRSIDKADLRPGDLLFFTVRGGDRVGHVGIYIGDGQMVHSSSSKGVIITPVDNPYFVTNYHSAGRVERYYAMMEKPAAKPSKKPAAAPKKPASAATETKMTASATTAKPKTTAKPAAKPATKSTAKPAAKPTAKPENTPEFDTPMPSQVFASKGANDPHSRPSAPTVPDNNDGDEEPDFFD